MKRINETKGYSEKYDNLLKNNITVYMPIKLVKRVTYGEYFGEPDNGFIGEMADGCNVTLDCDDLQLMVEDRDIPIKIESSVVLEEDINWIGFTCSNCECKLSNEYGYPHCPFCGQKLIW